MAHPIDSDPAKKADTYEIAREFSIAEIETLSGQTQTTWANTPARIQTNWQARMDLAAVDTYPANARETRALVQAEDDVAHGKKPKSKGG